MKNLMNRARYVMTGEDGASNMEFIVFVAVVLVIATTLFLLRDAIVDFLKEAIKEVKDLDVE